MARRRYASRGIHSRADRVWVAVLLVVHFAANLAVAWSALRVA